MLSADNISDHKQNCPILKKFTIPDFAYALVENLAKKFEESSKTIEELQQEVAGVSNQREDNNNQSTPNTTPKPDLTNAILEENVMLKNRVNLLIKENENICNRLNLLELKTSYIHVLFSFVGCL